MPIPYYIAPPHHVVPAQIPSRRIQRELGYGNPPVAANELGAIRLNINPDAVRQAVDIYVQEDNAVFANDFFQQRNPTLPEADVVVFDEAQDFDIEVDGDVVEDLGLPPKGIAKKFKVKTTKMQFDGLSILDKITLTKREFAAIVKTIFEHPEVLKGLVSEKKLTHKQSKIIFAYVNKLNAMNCACCRKFNPSLLKATPIEKELEPLLDIAQTNVKTRMH
jgi:hypothetical protein